MKPVPGVSYEEAGVSYEELKAAGFFDDITPAIRAKADREVLRAPAQADLFGDQG